MSIMDQAFGDGSYESGGKKPPAARTRLQVKVWYPEIALAEDVSKLPDAIAYYEQAQKDGERYLVPKGNLETLLTAQAGIVYYYESAYNDAQKISKWLEERLSHAKACKHVWFQTAEGRNLYGDLKATDLKQYIEADNTIFDLVEQLGYIDAAKLGLSSLVERLRERGIYLSMVAKLRAAGQSEIMIDASQESPLED